MSPRKEKGVLKIGDKRIIGIRRDDFGSISDFKLEGGDIVSYSQALQEGARGRLKGLVVKSDLMNGLVLVSSPDGQDDEDGLERLPEF